MKKRILYTILSFAVLVSFSSCEKFLTHDDPAGITDSQWWNTEADARNALSLAYNGLPAGTIGKEFMVLSALSDEAMGTGDYITFVKGLHNSTWNKAYKWQDNYVSIRQSNRLLENIDKVFMEAGLKARYKAEARALRAYYHLELLLFYGDIPIVTKSIQPKENSLTRVKKEEVYEYVVAELAAAANELPPSYTNSEAWRISSAACWALISRAALFFHKYEDARDNAKKIIDLNLYDLHPSYSQLFSYDGEVNKERIFIKSNGNVDAWDKFAPGSVGGRVVMSATDVVVNNFETKQGKTITELGADSVRIYKSNPNYRNNRDPRLASTILYPGQTFLGVVLNPFNQSPSNLDRLGVQYSTYSGYWIAKYLDTRDRNGTRSLDYVNIRYAEVLLNYAEALIELNDLANPNIVLYLNKIRKRAGLPNVNTTVYNSQTKLRELVRRERLSELAFEGQRFFDIRRWGIMGEVMNGNVYGATDPQTGIAPAVEIRNADPNRDFYYPIPNQEIVANPNITQNPGY